MHTYDDIVVGSGISGMTLALLLAMNGRSVLMLEKAPIVGGSMARFYKKGVPFDTGFHFTGGFAKDGLLTDMLKVLGLDDKIHPLFVDKPENNRFVFEDNGKSYEFPLGFDAMQAKLVAYFPAEEAAINKYFNLVKKVCAGTVSMDLRTITENASPVDEDFISLKDKLDELTDNGTLKALMASYAMCHGAAPSEVSFAAHSRVCYGLYEAVARVKDGGDAFVHNFKKALESFGVKIMTNTYIESCEDISKRTVGRFVLNNGESVKAQQCTFTIHPLEILKTLSEEKVSKAFADRVKAFEPSVGFFSLFAIVEEQNNDFDPAIISLFPNTDVEAMFKNANNPDAPLVLMKCSEEVSGKKYNVINAFELSLVDDVEAWADSELFKRPKAYYEYKEKHEKRIVERILAEFPQYEGKLKVLDAASMLTFRDYLNSPYGCAYGIKQKIGQFNLFGRLALRNIYAAGQSAVLPGVVGSMMSSFIVCRTLVGKEKYNEFIEKQLVG